MRRVVVLSLLVALAGVAGGAHAGEAPARCDAAGTQSELDACAGAHVGRADAELNRVWQAIQSRYADRPQFLAKLKVAQRAWLAFRDAELDARFPLAPGEQANVQYGSVFPMCASQFKATLTEQRTAQLKAWLDGVQEGEVCGGSVKSKEQLQ